jgi:hypothetical protein
VGKMGYKLIFMSDIEEEIMLDKTVLVWEKV